MSDEMNSKSKLMPPEMLAFFARLTSGEKFDCPCCGRWAQIYKRRIHASVAEQLLELHSLGGGQDRRFVHASLLIPKGQSGAGDIGKARYWGLIEQMKGVPQNLKSSGYWRMTGLGCDFVRGQATIMRTALIFDDKVVGMEGPEISITQCGQEKFDYQKLLKE